MQIKKKIGFCIANLMIRSGFWHEDIKAVESYFINTPDFRDLNDCEKKTGLSFHKCSIIKEYLYKTRKLGLYFFEEAAPPQRYMRKWIFRYYKHLSPSSNILEVGPGNNPIFPPKEYPNCKAVDRYFDGKRILFRRKEWGKDLYPEGSIRNGSYENLSAVMNEFLGSFDLVVGSHSYEHTWKPITALVEIGKMLKKGGSIVLFVPDGFTDDPLTKDPTHTIYVVPGMMEDFFTYAGGFYDVTIKKFRPNADLVITARKS